MAYFPFFVDIEGKEILVVGGGKVALRKIEKLMPFKPNITVIAPEICENIYTLDVKTVKRVFTDGDVDGKFCVICATDDEAVNAHVYKLCRERSIPINTVDDKEKCSFIFPALSGCEDVSVGISTSGKSPLFARFLRETIDGIFNEKLETTADILARYRPVIKRTFDDEKIRLIANEAVLKICLKSDGTPDECEIKEMLGRLKNGIDKNRNEKL